MRVAVAILMVVTFVAPAHGAEGLDVPRDVAALLGRYCVSCHGPDKQKGKVRLDQLSTMTAKARLDLLNKAHEALHFEEMPPEDHKQPTADERRTLVGWVNARLEVAGGAALKEKLRYPHYGNMVDHDQLFSGAVKDKAFTPARRWLVSPAIFHERVMDVFQLEGRERQHYQTRKFYGVTNPFVLTDQSGVRYYDLDTLDGGHLLVMLTNAEWIAGKQLFAARHKGIDPRKIEHTDPQDKWYPRTTPAAFEAVMLKDSTPSDAELIEAIQAQFGLALRRRATDAELRDYLALSRDAIALAGNAEGLRKMLVAVLLESEFVYRLEFGGGQPDAHGRRMLTPHEAAFAISYALGDRGPDEQLLKAAAEGRLNTREDYRREVTRLLDDKEYYRGQIDPTLNGKHYQSNVTSHPKLVRFFREFFGYPASVNVFKDAPRSGGKYQNPDRGTQGTPGWLTYEADKIVALHVDRDTNVFENLLTFDEFYVYDNMSAEEGRQLLAEWRGIYEKLKDTDWRTNPEQVLKDNLEFLKAQKSLRIKDASKPGEIVNYMHFFDESFGQGSNPFTRVPWSHGYYYHHSVFYNLPPTPTIGRYGSWKSTKYESNLEPQEFWDYPVEQPFKIAHRKGILTHPAWLIAHSTNFHSDSIRRGRWIREKLLAGRVPDVPITVDAQVPEDPHKTFRQRVEQVTQANECWKCHRHMNPLGLAFEMYDDFGRFRTVEPLEYEENLISKGNGKSSFDVYKTAPVVTTGELTGTGDPKLDGEVDDALEMIDRLAKSDRVRQSIIRHAFRFFMGRNETLSDSQTLIDADRAYLDSGGSFRAVVVSLLTSDSFMYRKDLGE